MLKQECLLLMLVVVAHCFPILDEKLRVVRKERDTMMEQMMCPKNSKFTKHNDPSRGILCNGHSRVENKRGVNVLIIS